MENLIFGFLTGGSLILVIGPQNIFVIEQGLKREYKDGKYHGQGTLTLTNGTRYEGNGRMTLLMDKELILSVLEQKG